MNGRSDVRKDEQRREEECMRTWKKAGIIIKGLSYVMAGKKRK